jgi:hypothetical protein
MPLPTNSVRLKVPSLLSFKRRISVRRYGGTWKEEYPENSVTIKALTLQVEACGAALVSVFSWSSKVVQAAATGLLCRAGEAPAAGVGNNRV